MEHLPFWSKGSIFPNIFKYMIFQKHQKALVWRKWLREKEDKDQESIQSSATPDPEHYMGK